MKPEPVRREIRVFLSVRELVAETAAILAGLAHSAGGRKPVPIALSGGSTPLALYRHLAVTLSAAEWENLEFWWVDERCVPPEDGESNYGNFRRQLPASLLPEARLHRIRGDAPDPRREARRYSEEMRRHLPHAGGFPGFRWVLLGAGEDGHTASLFPASPLLESRRPAESTTHPQSGQKRISVTPGVLAASDRLTFLLTGRAKSGIAAAILNGQEGGAPYPAARVHDARGRSQWFLDSDAASGLGPQLASEDLDGDL